MGLDIKYARLSKNGKVKSKLILDKRDTTVYDKDGKAIKMKIGGPTILVDESLEEEEAQNAIIHECVLSLWRRKKLRTLLFMSAFTLTFTTCSMSCRAIIGKWSAGRCRSSMTIFTPKHSVAA